MDFQLASERPVTIEFFKSKTLACVAIGAGPLPCAIEQPNISLAVRDLLILSSEC